MKRTILLSSLIALACAFAANAQTLTAASSPARCGATVRVPVAIDDVTGLLALELRVEYDASKLTATGVAVGDLTSAFQIASNLATPGLARIAMASGNAVSGRGTVVMITFKVANGVTGDAPLTLGNVLVNDVPKKAAGAVVTIACGEAEKADPAP